MHQTIRSNFRQSINNTLKKNLLPMAEQQEEAILQQYEKARTNLEETLAEEAEGKIAKNLQMQSEVLAKVKQYNEAVQGINSCLQQLELYESQLSKISLPH
ncbi:hypothetical protein [Halothece sp. PCC 7418]|uniref:hypothetical protein n=1 Tax=Halothece sp. (strain PCC 7418) TaxID=65093 RepID=UPI001C0A8954|nr:hypothetical protein [Halothece sp. PCC 7418]